MNRTALLSALLVAALVVPLALPAVASSPPRNVCGVCGQPFVSAAYDRGVNTSIEHSELTVRVVENGTGYWEARVTVNDAAVRQFRENDTLLISAVEATFSRYWTLVERPRGLTARLDGDEVVVTFAVPEMAHRSGGVLLVDYFNSHGDARPYRLDANRLVIRGPEGTALVNDPPGGTREDGAAVWTRTDDYASFSDETYVAFGRNRNLPTLAMAQASIAADAAPYLTRHLVAVTLLPTVLLGVGLAGVWFGLGRRETDWPAEWYAYAVVGLSVAWLAGLVWFGHGVRGYGALGWTLGVAFLGVGVLAATVPERATYRRLLGLAIGPALVGLVAVAPGLQVRGEFLTALVVVVTVALFLPLGYAARRGRGGRPLAAAILAAPVIAAVPQVPVGGFGPGFLSLFLGFWALGTAVAGAVLFRLGWTLAEARPTPTADG